MAQTRPAKGTGKPMKILCTLTALAAAATCSLAVASDTVFNVSGTINITGTDTFSGTLDINTATGAFVGGSLIFGSPATGITVPTLDLTGFETASGGSGTHLFIVELCASTDCSSNWLMNMTLDVTPSDGSLVGYAGGKINSVALLYGSIANSWGGCPLAPTFTPPSCGGITSPNGGGGGTHGVPEPTSAALLILGLTATCLSRRRRPA
jgi:hypothetical protein